MHLVYVLTFANGKRYVGYTGTSLAKRLSAHVAAAAKADTCMIVAHAIRKHGREGFAVHVAGEFDTRAEALAEEVRLIAAYGTQDRTRGYNMTAGGEKPPATFGGLNWKRKKTPEQIAAADAKKSRPGALNPFFGRRHSAETLARMVETRRRNGSYAGAALHLARNGNPKGTPVEWEGVAYPSVLAFARATGRTRDQARAILGRGRCR